MNIPFTCPHCGTQTEVDEKFAGTSGPCASCGKGITIPPLDPAFAHDSSDAAPGAAVAAAAVGGMSVVAIIVIAAAAVLAVICVIGMLVAMLLPAVQAAREAARRAQCANNLRQICVAMQMYETEHGTLPPAYLADETGKPMHSWRVLLLPYLEHEALYQQYNLDEPWDSPNNMAVALQMPSIYRCPTDPQTTGQETSYMVIVGPQTMFPGDTTTKLTDCPDGAGNTLCVVEAPNASVGWTDPTDLKVKQMRFEIGAGGNMEVDSYHVRGANVVFCDGQIQFLPDSLPAEDLEALSTRNGGEEVYIPR